MANALFDAAREAFLGGDLDWDANSIKINFIDHADYNPNLAVDAFLSAILPAAIVATSGALANKTKVAGVADADDITLNTVVGDQFESFCGYSDTGVAGTSRLIFKIDTATGLPCTPNGGNITVQWDSGANRIFKL